MFVIRQFKSVWNALDGTLRICFCNFGVMVWIWLCHSESSYFHLCRGKLATVIQMFHGVKNKSIFCICNCSVRLTAYTHDVLVWQHIAWVFGHKTETNIWVAYVISCMVRKQSCCFSSRKKKIFSKESFTKTSHLRWNYWIVEMVFFFFFFFFFFNLC